MGKVNTELMKLPSIYQRKNGFTLIELLVIITLIILLSVTVFVALNPGGRLSDARDARRAADIQSILTAIHQSIVDNKGSLPSGLSVGMDEKQLGTATTGCILATGGCSVAAAGDCVDLTTSLVKYLKSIPIDPNGGTAALTKYSVVVDANKIVTVRACGTEGSTNILTSR